MTDLELIFSMLGEASTTAIKTGEKVVSKDNYLPEGKKTKQLNKGKKKKK
jgi:hypothetical protein